MVDGFVAHNKTSEVMSNRMKCKPTLILGKTILQWSSAWEKYPCSSQWNMFSEHASVWSPHMRISTERQEKVPMVCDKNIGRMKRWVMGGMVPQLKGWVMRRKVSELLTPKDRQHRCISFFLWCLHLSLTVINHKQHTSPIMTATHHNHSTASPTPAVIHQYHYHHQDCQKPQPLHSHQPWLIHHNHFTALSTTNAIYHNHYTVPVTIAVIHHNHHTSSITTAVIHPIHPPPHRPRKRWGPKNIKLPTLPYK